MSGLCSLELGGARMAQCSRGWDAQKGRVALTKEPYSVSGRGVVAGRPFFGRFAMRCDATDQWQTEMLGVRAVADAVAVGWDAQQQGKGKRLAGEMKKWQKLAKSGVIWREAARKARQNRVQTSLLGSF